MRDKILFSILFIFLAVVFALPHIYGLLKLKNAYWPLQSVQESSFIGEETYAYAPEVQQLLRLKLTGDPYLYERRDDPSPFIGEVVSLIPVGVLSIILGSVANAFIISDAIFPAALFGLIFVGLRSLGINKIQSVAISLAVIVTPFLSLLLPQLADGGTLVTGAASSPLFFSRTPHPQISTIFLFSVLFLTISVLKEGKGKIIYYWAFSTGLSLYASPYVSSTVFFAALLLTPQLLKKLSKKDIFSSSLIILTLALPWLINYLNLEDLTKDSSFLLRASFSKDMIFPGQLRYLAFALTALFFLRDKKASFVIASFLISASILADMHQLIFGRNIEADHWLSRVLAPIGTMAILLLANQFLEKSKNIKLLWSTLTILILTIGATTQASWIKSHRSLFKSNPQKTLLMRQILASTGKDEVIATNSVNLNNEIAALTGRLVYLAPGDRTLATDDEQILRSCDVLKYFKEETNQNQIMSHRNYVFGLHIFDNEKTEELSKKHEDCLTTSTTEPFRYKIDYIVNTDSDGLKLTRIKKQE